MLQFNPSDAKERSKFKFIEGVYQFVVVDAEEGVSKNGSNAQIIVTHDIFKSGRHFTVKDYFTIVPTALWRLEQFWGAVGHPEMFSQGILIPEMFYEHRGFAFCGVQYWKGHQRPKVLNYLLKGDKNDTHR